LGAARNDTANPCRIVPSLEGDSLGRRWNGIRANRGRATALAPGRSRGAFGSGRRFLHRRFALCSSEPERGDVRGSKSEHTKNQRAPAADTEAPQAKHATIGTGRCAPGDPCGRLRRCGEEGPRSGPEFRAREANRGADGFRQRWGTRFGARRRAPPAALAQAFGVCGPGSAITITVPAVAVAIPLRHVAAGHEKSRARTKKTKSRREDG